MPPLVSDGPGGNYDLETQQSFWLMKDDLEQTVGWQNLHALRMYNKIHEYFMASLKTSLLVPSASTY